ncbi:DUF2865 domain-containing protein [Bauldia sp.]|uniref:DUF2865 domain-containing protein n=1 Tax=Bauldia sp. TaxID=2575872 RepID=UPI003BA8A2DE
MKHIAIFVFVGGLLSAGTAAAETGICATLEARLVAIDSRTDDYWNGGQSESHRAIARKRDQLEEAEAAVRRANCDGAGLFRRLKRNGQCGRLAGTVERLRARIRRLESERGAMAADPYSADRERSEVLRALADNRCGSAYARYDRDKGKRPGLFRSLFGNRRVFRDRSGFGSGTYRTLCVRACDGYYFPVSFAATPSAFDRDANACQALCPGIDVALYVHRNPGEEAAQMVSLSGEPYTALPTAFRYRTEYDRSCSCPTPIVPPVQMASAAAPVVSAGEIVDLDLTVGSIHTTSSPRLDTALPRPRAGTEDPETVANRAGGLAPERVDEQSPVETVTVQGEDGRMVRVVGPQFYAPDL